MDKIKGLNRFTRVLAKAVELRYWMAAGAMAVLLGVSLAAGGWLAEKLRAGQEDLNLYSNSLATHGFELVVAWEGCVDMRAFTLFCVVSAIILVLMAMVFHTIWRIMKETGDNPGEKGFQASAARQVKRIGYLFLGVTAVSLTASVIARLVLGPEAAETSVGIEYLLLGLLMLYLAQIFAYGEGLQKDLDGLV